jgi:hypothetical protein
LSVILLPDNPILVFPLPVKEIVICCPRLQAHPDTGKARTDATDKAHQEAGGSAVSVNEWVNVNQTLVRHGCQLNRVQSGS